MKMLKTFMLMPLIAAFLYACGAAGGGGTDISVNDVGNVEGTVTDSTTENPLSGVTVQIGDKSDVTGDDGVYSIQDIDVGTRTVTASKTGYQNHNGTCEISKGTTVSHDIQLTANTSSDTTPPTVSSTSPANNAIDIAVNSAVTVTFSEAMDVSTITTSTFILEQGATPISGMVTYSGTTATFTPSANLDYSTTYTATISTGVNDTAGNAMASNYSWSFTTGAALDTTAPTLLVSGVSPTSVAVDATNVYWSDSLNWSASTSSVKKVSINGGAVTTLASNLRYTSSLVVDATNVYWGDNGSVNKVPINGGTVTYLAYGYSTPIVVDSSNIYIAFSPNGVESIAISNGAVTTLASDSAGGAAPYAIAVDSTSVYWSNWFGSLYKVSKNGGTVTTLVSSNVYASALAVDATSVYWSDDSGVHKIPINGGTVTTLASNISPVYIVVDTASANVYWATATSVGKVSIDGGTVQTLASSQPPSYVTNGNVSSNCIAVDSTSLYWGSANGLYKIPK